MVKKLASILIAICFVGCVGGCDPDEQTRKVCQMGIGTTGYTLSWAIVEGSATDDLPVIRSDYPVSKWLGGTLDYYILRTSKDTWSHDGQDFREHPMWNCRPDSEKHW